MIQEPGESAKALHQKIDELATLPELTLPEADVAQLSAIGNNKGCMVLKGRQRRGGGRNHRRSVAADARLGRRWPAVGNWTCRETWLMRP